MKRYSGWVIVSDYDGTIATGFKSGLSDQNRDAIAGFIRDGGRFGVATGRGSFEIDALIRDQVCFNFPGIYYNGALVRDPKTAEILYRAPLPEDYKDMVDTLLAEFSDVQVYVGNWDRLSIVNNPAHSDEMLKDVQRSNMGIEMGSDALEKLRLIMKTLRPWDILEPLSAADDTAYKLLFSASERRIAQLQEKMRGMDSKNRYKIFKSFNFNLEVVSASAGKGTALNWLQGHLPVEQTLALGDGQNDVEMFKAADYSLAPALAHPGAKAAATVSRGESGEIVPTALALIDAVMRRKGI